MKLYASALVLSVLVVGCGGSDNDAGVADAGATDASVVDAGSLDAGAVDAGVADAGGVDAGGVDAGAADAGDVDAGAVDAGAPDAGSVDAGAVDGGPTPGCTLVFCFTGATTRNDASNAPFGALCDTLVDGGLVRDCAGGSCFSTFNTFLVNASTTLYPKVFAALDVTADQRVDGSDPACRLVLIGYSWGGVSAVNVAAALAQDTRVSATRRSVDLIALDPFQPGLNGRLEVPANVATFTELRHSVSPPNDCSRSAPLGPYMGLTPFCRATSSCVDYDYSLSPNTVFARYTTGGYFGRNIGHCEVPEVTHAAVRALLRGQPLTGVPMTRPVATIP